MKKVKVEDVPVVKRGPGRPRKVVVSEPVVAKTTRRKAVVKTKPIIEKPYIPSIKITMNNSGFHQVAVSKKGSKYDNTFGGITQSPTSNCQLFSWASFNNIISAYKNDPALFTRLCNEVSMRMGKKLMLVDLNFAWVNTFKTLVPANRIVLDAPYVSTNGSNMNILIFRP